MATLFVSLAFHYDEVIMDVMASQITRLTIVYSTVYSDADQRKHQSSAPLALIRVSKRGPRRLHHPNDQQRDAFGFIEHQDNTWDHFTNDSHL